MNTKDKVELLVRIGVWEDFKKAWAETRGTTPLIGYLKRATPPLLIKSAFRWSETPQRHRYWEAADSRLKELPKGEEVGL